MILIVLYGVQFATTLDIFDHFLHLDAEFLLPRGSPHEIVQVLQVEDFQVEALLDDSEQLLFGVRSTRAFGAIDSRHNLASEIVGGRKHACTQRVFNIVKHLRQLLSIPPVLPPLLINLNSCLQVDHLFLQLFDLKEELSVFVLRVTQLLLEAFPFSLHLQLPFLLTLLHALNSIFHFSDELVLSLDNRFLLLVSIL